mmetsp:Transcript_56613/g.143320  ORF Transcript_56613/g.143320 Transcript_56613/m.143320 type:complete len:203 (+) Transcript_56613:135-743(+)
MTALPAVFRKRLLRQMAQVMSSFGSNSFKVPHREHCAPPTVLNFGWHGCFSIALTARRNSMAAAWNLQHQRSCVPNCHVRMTLNKATRLALEMVSIEEPPDCLDVVEATVLTEPTEKSEPQESSESGVLSSSSEANEFLGKAARVPLPERRSYFVRGRYSPADVRVSLLLVASIWSRLWRPVFLNFLRSAMDWSALSRKPTK